MRTLEFGLYPTKTQEQQLLGWLKLQRHIWNFGLSLLIELDRFAAYDKVSKERVPCCPVPWSYRWQKTEDGEWLAVPYSEVRHSRISGLCCPIPEVYCPPRLNGDSYFTLAAFFAKKNHPNWPELKECPRNLIRGTLQALATAWKEHKSGKRDSMGRRRKIPRFKSMRFPITTLNDIDCKKTCSVDSDHVKLPILGDVRIKGNKDGRRWPSDLTVATYRIKKEPSGWYLFLVGNLSTPNVRKTNLKVGIDVGVVHTLTTDNGKHIDGPKPLKTNLLKLKQLQQQMSRQKKGSSNYKKTAIKFARLHEKIRRTRKLFAHKSTTYLLRTYGIIAIENLKIANMVRRPASKPAEDGTGTFLPNQAAAKSGLNRSMNDSGLGQICTMLKTKGKELGRTIIAVDAKYTSQCCSVCGHTESSNRPSQELFLCQSCGHTENADVNAAKNILAKIA